MSNKRLQQAREHAGYRSASEAARDLGLAPSTYMAHENGSRRFDIETAREYAKAFNISTSWLLTGQGAMKEKCSPAAAPTHRAPGGQIPVVAEVSPGAWNERRFHEREKHAEGHDRIYLTEGDVALHVVDGAGGDLVQDGSIIIGNDHDVIREGDIVLVEEAGFAGALHKLSIGQVESIADDALTVSIRDGEKVRTQTIRDEDDSHVLMRIRIICIHL